MWPKGPTYWLEDRVMCVSIPFTFNLQDVRNELLQVNMMWDTAEVGGPATQLMPDFFSDLPHVTVGKHKDGVLQRINPLATRTTLGCTRKCKFCAIGTGRVEGGGMVELNKWPNLPVYCDNNLLAASDSHVEKVMLESIERGHADFNQGLDARLLTKEVALMLGAIKKPTVRVSLDHKGMVGEWENAVDLLRECGTAKSNISTYALIGFMEPPEESWKRCEIITAKGVQINPQWYHSLDALECNTVTDKQAEWGWTEKDRTQIMGYYYRRRGEKPAYLKNEPPE